MGGDARWGASDQQCQLVIVMDDWHDTQDDLLEQAAVQARRMDRARDQLRRLADLDIEGDMRRRREARAMMPDGDFTPRGVSSPEIDTGLVTRDFSARLDDLPVTPQEIEEPFTDEQMQTIAMALSLAGDQLREEFRETIATGLADLAALRTDLERLVLSIGKPRRRRGRKRARTQQVR
jgi:hypothetical protein